MYWKFKYKLLGGHYHVSVFTSKLENGTFAKLGDLVMGEKDFESLELFQSDYTDLIFEEKESI